MKRIADKLDVLREDGTIAGYTIAQLDDGFAVDVFPSADSPADLREVVVDLLDGIVGAERIAID